MANEWRLGFNYPIIELGRLDPISRTVAPNSGSPTSRASRVVEMGDQRCVGHTIVSGPAIPRRVEAHRGFVRRRRFVASVSSKGRSTGGTGVFLKSRSSARPPLALGE
ncbi:hypothetical protein PIB30_044145 [Stylosanthes scabra]|uniref:Uncharacterized protein n=1 Tax=Stylosanthes scabra TaxID=79078 RepID=A0ABU6VHM3_9FABA|nr:hypothetical protein [Stylosanthes scabra]